jgi:hypothetical protein
MRAGMVHYNLWLVQSLYLSNIPYVGININLAIQHSWGYLINVLIVLLCVKQFG